jgi:hypothetical protein
MIFNIEQIAIYIFEFGDVLNWLVRKALHVVSNLKLTNMTPTEIINKVWKEINYIKKIVQQPKFAYFSILI